VWVRSPDPFDRNFDRTVAVADCNRAVLFAAGEVDRLPGCGALSPTERSTTRSVRSASASPRSRQPSDAPAFAKPGKATTSIDSWNLNADRAGGTDLVDRGECDVAKRNAGVPAG
jgi:hypothetical protein